MIACAGHLRLRAAARPDGATVLAHQSFRAPFHLSKPYWDSSARTLVVQVVNPTAGILGGDRLGIDISVEAGAALHVTTPSASRIFSMNAEGAECDQRFTVAKRGWLELAPEPLVPHRASRYRQVTRVDVEPGGSLWLLEQLVPGRIGHGETWAWEHLSLALDVRVGGRPILRERFTHAGAELRALAELGGTGIASCFASAVLIAGDADPGAPWAASLAALHAKGVWVGASALPGAGWTIKIVAPDPLRLRDTVKAVRQALTPWVPALASSARKL